MSRSAGRWRASGLPRSVVALRVPPVRAVRVRKHGCISPSSFCITATDGARDVRARCASRLDTQTSTHVGTRSRRSRPTAIRPRTLLRTSSPRRFTTSYHAPERSAVGVRFTSTLPSWATIGWGAVIGSMNAGHWWTGSTGGRIVRARNAADLSLIHWCGRDVELARRAPTRLQASASRPCTCERIKAIQPSGAKAAASRTVNVGAGCPAGGCSAQSRAMTSCAPLFRAMRRTTDESATVLPLCNADDKSVAVGANGTVAAATTGWSAAHSRASLVPSRKIQPVLWPADQRLESPKSARSLPFQQGSRRAGMVSTAPFHKVGNEHLPASAKYQHSPIVQLARGPPKMRYWSRFARLRASTAPVPAAAPRVPQAPARQERVVAIVIAQYTLASASQRREPGALVRKAGKRGRLLQRIRRDGRAVGAG